MKDTIKKICEKLVFESRWLLYPFNIGLILALGVYVIRFLIDDYYFITHSMSANLEDVVVMLLGLVDSFMVANLIIMIVKGSYQIFIHKFEIETEHRPGWLDHIDTGLLKVKTAQSIASITGVALLKDFVNLEKMGWVLVEHRLVVHSVCLISALVMALIWRITHGDPNHHAAEPHHTPVETHITVKENAHAH
jgi:uncharacterized protein (TIGR00645 family)